MIPIVEMNEILDKRDKIMERLAIGDYSSEEECKQLLETADRYFILIEDEIKQNFNNYPVDFIIQTFHRLGDTFMPIYDPEKGYAYYTFLNQIDTLEKNQVLDEKSGIKIPFDASAYAFVVNEDDWSPTIREAVWKWIKYVEDSSINNLIS